MATWTNPDGLEVRFGSDIGKRGSKSAVTTGAGKRRELVLTVDLTKLGVGGVDYTADLNNDGTLDGFNPSNTPLPASVKILGFNEIILETPVTTTGTYTIGTYQENGTVDDADGIRTSAGAAGAQVGTTLTASRFVAASVQTAVFTAGKVKVIVEYMTV